MRFIDYKTSEVLMQSLASAVEVELNDAIKNRGVATLLYRVVQLPNPFLRSLEMLILNGTKLLYFPLMNAGLAWKVRAPMRD